MTKIFASSAKHHPPVCLGGTSIGSCGLCPRAAPIPRKPSPRVARGNWSSLSASREAIAINIIGEGTAQGVPLNITVISVRARTGLFIVIFVPSIGIKEPRPPPVDPPSPPLAPAHSRLPLPQLPTPVNIDRLLFFLSGYTHSIVEFLSAGFFEGFPLHFEGPSISSHAPNLLSALQNPAAVDAKISKELAAHRLAGPFSSPPFPVFRVSPLGLIPKKTPGEFRLIHHLSFPNGSSLNDGISPVNTSVSYATVEDAIRFIKTVGSGCFLAKTDIKNAFRIIPIRPQDYHLLGIFWKGFYYYDAAMPMGCASSCKTFEMFSTAIGWIAQNKLHIPYILHLLDDFLIVAHTEEQCKGQLDLFLMLCSYLGIPMAPEKTVGPSTTIAFAGIELDSALMQARLPNDKLVKCRALISVFLTRKKVTLKEIQSLTGLLNFACSVVVPGRAFLRRLIDLTIGVRAPHFRIRLSREVKADLRVWQTFLSSFNGRSFFLSDAWCTSNQVELYTDASGAHGFGAIFGPKWCYGKWPDSWRHKNIAFLEFYPIVLSLHLWGSDMRNRRILFFTDNEALVHIINKQSCRDKDLMVFVRKLVLVCLSHNIVFKAKHIPGVQNKLADALSRLQLQTFKQLAPAGMHPHPTEIPLHLQPPTWPT